MEGGDDTLPITKVQWLVFRWWCFTKHYIWDMWTAIDFSSFILLFYRFVVGKYGEVIRPTNQNNGVASVALVMLQKLVVPLKILNSNDRELVLLKEIVLFNPGKWREDRTGGDGYNWRKCKQKIMFRMVLTLKLLKIIIIINKTII